MANTFKVRFLKAMEGTNDIFEVVTNSYAVPEGGVVADADKFAEVLTEASEYVYSTRLALAVEKAEKAYQKAEKRLDDCKGTVADVEKARKRLEVASEKYGTYPRVPVCDDDFAVFVACTILAPELINVDKASKMLAHLRREDIEATECKRDIVAYMNDNFNLRVERRDYVKPYDVASGLNLAKVENIRKVAQVETLKWTSLGIEGKKASDGKVLQQVILTIFRDAFRLEVEKKEKAGKFYLV